MRLAAAICAHPVRRETALDVQKALDREVPLIFDENPVPSADPLQRWTTHRNAWEAALASDPTADAVIVLQDDILVSRDLLAGLEVALDHIEPGGFIASAYTGTGRPDQRNVRRALTIADMKGESWIRTRSLNWGPSIILPADAVEEMIEKVDKHIRSTYPPKSNTDYAIGVWARDVKKWATLYTVPSLVEHRRLPSLVGHDKGPVRRAHRFIGAKKSALDVDWSKVPRGGLTARL